MKIKTLLFVVLLSIFATPTLAKGHNPYACIDQAEFVELMSLYRQMGASIEEAKHVAIKNNAHHTVIRMWNDLADIVYSEMTVLGEDDAEKKRLAMEYSRDFKKKCLAIIR
jgi:hypothetical protein